MSEESHIDILDHGFILLQDVMGSDVDVVEAARATYRSVLGDPGGRRANDKSADRLDIRLIHRLMRDGHTSPFEMAEMRFLVQLPIFVARQWVRHRTANINEFSARYSTMPAVFYVPELDRIRYQHATNKQMSGEPMDEAEARRAQQDIHNASLYAYDEYERLLDMGVSRELARVVLPLNMYTRWVWKCDLHNILNFLKLRMAEDAQPEIRAYAFGIAHFVRREFPNVWQAFVEKHQIDLTDDPSEP